MLSLTLGRAASKTPQPQLVASGATLWVEADGLRVRLRVSILTTGECGHV